MWLSWLGIIPQTERLSVRFLVRANAWVVGLVPIWGAYGRQLIDASVPLFLPSSLSINLKKYKKNQKVKRIFNNLLSDYKMYTGF